jgi:RecG-like helicase
MPPYCHLNPPNLLFSANLVQVQQVYVAIREELSTGGRVYIVCPLVSKSSSDAVAGVKQCC